MPVDPVIHAHMAYLVQREKKDRAQAEKLEEEIALWKKRISLAESRGKGDLADQARQRARELVASRRELQTQLDMIETEKGMLRKESRRPDGHELAYAEELLRRWQESGLVDPDQAVLDRQFDDLNAEEALAELRADVGEEDGKTPPAEVDNQDHDEVIFPDLDADSDAEER